MTITTLSSRQFNQDVSGAKKAAQHGPVIITDRGWPAHVLLTIEQYQQLTGKQASIVDLLPSGAPANSGKFPSPTPSCLTPPPPACS